MKNSNMYFFNSMEHSDFQLTAWLITKWNFCDISQW